jgi:hypothetical protein
MVHSSRSRLAPTPLPLTVRKEQICPVFSVSNLGSICHLAFEDQIRSTRKRCYFHLRRIVRLRQFYSSSITANLITGLVFPILDYGNSLLAGLPEKNISQLQLVQNSAARLATKILSKHLSLQSLPVSIGCLSSKGLTSRLLHSSSNGSLVVLPAISLNFLEFPSYLLLG